MSDTDRATIEKLRLRAYHGEKLTVEEQATLDAFYRRIAELETPYLNRLAERMDSEHEMTEERIRELEEVLERLRSSYRQLQSLVHEIDSLEGEADRILSASRSVVVSR
jgi:uncharacterized protein Yka (UPF0111/DUF47 family)